MVEDTTDAQEEHQQELEPEAHGAKLARLVLPFGMPDVYTDSFAMTASAYTVSLHFAVSEGPVLKPQAIVRMSPQHAKVMAILFMRRLKEYEKKAGEIGVPESLLREKDIDFGRDWNAV